MVEFGKQVEEHTGPRAPEGYITVRMLETVHGTRDGRTMETFEAGQTYIMPAGPYPLLDIGIEMIKTGQGVEVKPEPEAPADPQGTAAAKAEQEPAPKAEQEVAPKVEQSETAKASPSPAPKGRQWSFGRPKDKEAGDTIPPLVGDSVDEVLEAEADCSEPGDSPIAVAQPAPAPAPAIEPRPKPDSEDHNV